jgi:Tol biopolymer transport system component
MKSRNLIITNICLLIVFGFMTVGSATAAWDIKPLVDSNANEYSPTWSPDGRQVAYLSDETGPRQLYIINSDGTDKWQVTSGPNSVSYIAWSPDSQYILYTKGNLYPTNLFKCKLNSSRDGIEQCWNLSSEPVTVYSLYWESPQVAPADCNHIAASRAANGWPRLRTITDRDADATESDWTAIGDQVNGMSVNPTFHPNDCLIAYAYYINYQPWYLGDVLTIEADGANHVKVLDRSVTGQHVRSVAWGPDGDCIAFSEQYGAASRLGIVCADGGVWPDAYNASSVTWLDDPCSAIPPQKYSWQADIWSPQGSSLVYSRNVNGRWDIWLVTNSGSKKTPVVESAGNDREARFSVDGTIVFQTDRDGNWDIYLAVPLFAGDLDGDRRVDFRDFAIFVAYWLECDPLDPDCWP